MRFLKVYLILLLTYVGTNGEADPAPAADASPQQSMMTDPRTGQLSMMPPQSPCELTNQCCNMDNSQCCLGGKQQQKCYTVFKMKCDNEDKPRCKVRSDYHCHDVQVKQCRAVTAMETRYFNMTECVEKPAKKCFDYQRVACDKKEMVKTVPITYVTQSLVSNANQTKKHCIPQKMYNCTDRTYTDNTQQRVPVQKKVTENQRRCQMVRVQAPDQQMVVPVTRIVYRNVCYNVPTPQCTQSACSGGLNSCPSDTSVCSTTDFNTRTICPQLPNAPTTGGTGLAVPFGPTAVGGRASCQTVQTPACGNPSMCNSPNQQCCSTVNQQVCRQVPVRVVENVPQTIPGQMTWKEDCKEYPMEKTVVVYETVNNPVTKTKKECTPVQQPTCHDYIVPSYDVVSQERTQDVPLTISQCELKPINDQHCFTYNEYECKERRVSRNFKVTKQVCDVVTNQQQCSNLPVTDCSLGQTANCQMVPQQVCQDTCSNSQLCNTCNNFVNGPGFGSCSSSTCGNFIPGVNVPGGEGYYPGGGDPGLGGEGYFPGGTGGQGYFPGGEGSYPGGDGFYPGGPGGEGYFPGGQPGPDGGEGYFPGGPGGEGFYPGYPGGNGYYPGGVGGDGGFYEEPGFSRPPYTNPNARPPYYSRQEGFNMAPAVPDNGESAIKEQEATKSA